MSKQSEALKIASEIELAITCGFIGSAAQYQHLLLSAVSQLRAPHARVEELEKDRGNAKRLVSKIWNQHPEARDTIEKATGAWLVFGQDIETDGVSAQRVTQAADHIAQDRKMMTAQETNGLLARIEKEISAAQINNHRMAAKFGKMEGEPCVRISSLLATIGGFLNEATDEQTAAPVVLPEPAGWRYPAPDSDFHYYEERRGFPVECKHLNYEPLYTEQQVRELLATSGQAQADARDAERWVSESIAKPLEADGEVFVRFSDGTFGTGWAAYWHGASNDFAQWCHPDPDEDRTVTHWMKPPTIDAAIAAAKGE